MGRRSLSDANAGALEALDVMQGLRVLVAGDFLLDRYVLANSTRLSREAPVVILQHESDHTNLGGAGNATRNVQALGGQPVPLGIVGADRDGDRVVQLLEEAGVDARGILRDPERPTITKTRILAGGSNAAKQQVLRIDQGIAYGPSQVRQLSQHARTLLGDVDGVLLSDYGYETLAPPVRSCIIQVARMRRIPSGADSRYQLTEFRGVGVATPNEEEAGAILGRILRSDADVTTAGRELMTRLGSPALVLTRGRRGMRIFEGSGTWRDIPAARQGEVADVTGAGDTVASALMLALAAGADVLEAAVLANAAASVVVARRGAATATPAEVRSVLAAGRDERAPLRAR